MKIFSLEDFVSDRSIQPYLPQKLFPAEYEIR